MINDLAPEQREALSAMPSGPKKELRRLLVGHKTTRRRESAHKNDWNRHYVADGERPQNNVHDDAADRLDGYPELKLLSELKDAQVRQLLTPAMYLRADLTTLPLFATLQTRFETLLVDPPWREYSERAPGLGVPFLTLEQLSRIRVQDVAAPLSFLWLWCGSAPETREQGSALLRAWGFRRIEDVCWLKRNVGVANRRAQATALAALAAPPQLLARTKEHCIVGVRGARRGRESAAPLVHTHCDTDVVLSEEPPFGSTAKPDELYRIAERFCRSRRRLELFADNRNIRPGWVSIGSELATSNWNVAAYEAAIGSDALLPFDAKIESLRSRSPEPQQH